MRAADHVAWVLMPENRDHANATELRRQVVQDAPENVVVLLDPAPHLIGKRAVLLAAPPAERHPARDLMHRFDSAATSELVRIGLAHGSVTDFAGGEDGG